MARAAAVLCALAVAACSDDPYVIGRYVGGDAADDAGSSECEGVHAGAVLCSGFEPADLGSEWVEDIVGGATLERSTARAHSGRAALHASSSAMMSVATVGRTFEALHAGELYFRAYVYVPGDLPTETMNIFFVGDGPETEPFVGIDFNREGGATQGFSPQSNPARHTGELVIARDRWFCYRARVVIGDGDGLVQIFVDDELALQTPAFDTLPPDGIDTFRAGVDWSSGQDAFFEIFIDDVVVDTAEVACL
jgi:hypothetical protein